jgi:hypothetical protein
MEPSVARQNRPASDPPEDSSAGAGAVPVRLIALTIVLLALLAMGGLLLWPRGGAYPLLEHDHDELMVSKTAQAGTTVTVLFVGNSLTFRNDLPAMLVNLASSDPGNTARLQVKGETYPDASLQDMFGRTGVLDWARDHHPDYVVLQEHSFWYDGGYEASQQAAGKWADALRPLRLTPLLFEVWTDGDGSDVFTRGTTPTDDARNAAESTARLGRQLGLPVVTVGEAFETARETPGAPNLYASDRHHPSVAGTYLAALVFYRFFTGRTGAEATYVPDGLSKRDAAVLVRVNGG